MSKQQTAVEWLIEQLQKTRDYQRVINEANQSSTSVRDVIDEAKEMEKQQIVDGIDYFKKRPYTDIEPKQYYNETYGGNK
jgi:hypothetical protein